MAYSKLTTSDLSEVRNEVFSAASKWYDIGLELKLTADDLDTIKKANNDEPLDCLREMLRKWLSGADPEPSWKSLIAALCKPVINYSALAKEIELKFCATSIESAESQQPVSSDPNSGTYNVNELPTTMPELVDMLDNCLSASTPKPRPVPKPRRSSKTLDPLKRKLVQSFESSTSNEVSQSQIEKAKKCINSGGTRDERYTLVGFEKLLNENQKVQEANYLTLMISSFERLLKYTINLIVPKQHSKWRSINIASTVFKSQVASMKGYEEILQTAGYTEKEDNSLSFPDHVQEPDKAKVSVLAAELLMAKLEVEQMNSLSSQDTSPTSMLRSVGAFKSPFHQSQKKHSPTKPKGVSFPVRRKKRASLESYVMPSRMPTTASPGLRPVRGSFSYNQEDSSATYNGFNFFFIYPPHSSLFCQQCESLAYEPHQSLCCDSLFCKRCLKFDKCPICLVPDASVPDRRSDKLIQSLSVWCPNSIAGGLGCEWFGELRAVSDHRKECPREPISCSYSVVGCGEKMYRSKLEEHEIESREIHLNLAMKKVVSLTTTVEELCESVEQLKTSFQEFKEQYEMYN